MTTTNKTLTIKNYRHNREVDSEESNTTRVKIAITPAAGERFGAQGMEQASKQAAIAAFELAASFLRQIPPGCSYCVPEVRSGETWAGGASAFVTFDHDGVPVAISAVQTAVERARK